jgi:hypothetical protein
MAIRGFLKEAVTSHKAQNPIERRLMRFAGARQMFNRLGPAGLDEIGNAKLGDGADGAAQGRANQDAAEVFSFFWGP